MKSAESPSYSGSLVPTVPLFGRFNMAAEDTIDEVGIHKNMHSLENEVTALCSLCHQTLLEQATSSTSECDASAPSQLKKCISDIAVADQGLLGP